jgi:hypothetical protein
MHRTWIAFLAALSAFAVQAAVVYKWTDSDGVVHYSDQPVPGAQKITTDGGSAAAAASTATNPQQPQDPKPEPAGLGYTESTITSPTPEQTFFGDEAVSVRLTLEPGLKPNHTITWHLNGRELDDQPPTATQFTLPHLDRGTYAIAATVKDQETGESESTASVTFYVRQPSALSPQHKSP